MLTWPYYLYLWDFRAAYVGPSPENTLHRHHAAQLCVGLERSLRVRTSDTSPWMEAVAITIAPGNVHQIDAQGGMIMAVYWEPESRHCPISEHPAGVQPHRIVNPPAVTDDVPMDVLWDRWASDLAIDTGTQGTWATDPRIEAVVQHVRAEPHGEHCVDALASRVHLSASRLQHLFVEDLGISVRQFVLWTRIRAVVQNASQGVSLTRAAVAAGFADAAHMTNTFRRTFGFAPSRLFSVPGRIRVGSP